VKALKVADAAGLNRSRLSVLETGRERCCAHRPSALRCRRSACHAAIGALSDGTSAQECIGELSERLLQIQTGSDDSPAERVLQFSDAVYREWELLADGSDAVIGLTTGVDCVDLATTGIRDGETWAIGGRTGDGKTSLALQIAAANCRRDVAVGIFSVEMSKGELLQRLWSHEGKIPFGYIRNPRGAAPKCGLRCCAQ
jgi:replicative DNA helicase